VIAGLASLLAGPAGCVLAAAGAPAIPDSMPWLAMACSVVAVAGVCVVAFKKPNRSKGQ